MTDINTAKAQARQARSQLEEQKKQVKEGKTKALKQLELLNQAQSKIPTNTSARALRQNMKGLQGRNQRIQIEKVKQNISSQKQEVKNYLGKLKNYSGELSTYEKTQLKPFESSISNYESEQNAMKSAQKYYDANIPWAFVEGKAQKYLKRLYKFHNLQKAAFTKQIDTFVTANPTEKLDIDWKNLRIKGVQSGALNKNFADLKSYNSAIKDFNKKLKTPKVNTTITSPTVLPPTTSKNLTAGITGGAIFQLASAQSLNKSGGNLNNGINSNIQLGRNNSRVGSGSHSGNNFLTNLFGSPSDFNPSYKKETGQLRIEPYNASQYGKQYEPPKPSGIGAITGAIINAPGLALASARDYSRQQATLVNSEKLLGLGNVGSVNNVPVTSFGVPVTQLKVNQNLRNEQINIQTQARDLNSKLNDLKGYQIPKFEKENSINGTFNYNALDKTKQNQYDKLINQSNRYVNKINNLYSRQQNISSQTTPMTFFGNYYTNKVPNTELTNLFSYPKAYAGTFAKGAGKSFGTMVGDIGDVFSVGVGTKPQAVLDLSTGTYRLPNKKELNPPNALIKPATEVGETIFGAVPYLNPYTGTALVASDIGSNLGNYGFSPSRFWAKSTPEEKINVGFDLAFLGGGAITKGRSLIKSSRISKAVGKELETLNNVKFKGLIYRDEASGKVYADAYRQTGNVKETIRYYGELDKSGKFIPNGAGQRIIEGTAIPKKSTLKIEFSKYPNGQYNQLVFSKGSKDLTPQIFKVNEKFGISASGKAFPKGTLSDVPIPITLEGGGKANIFSSSKKRVYGLSSATGVVPKELRFGFTESTQSERAIKSELKRQLKIKRKLGDRTLYLEFPSREENLIEFDKRRSIVLSPKEETVIITNPKSEKAKDLGGYVFGKKSSQEFLDNMWKEPKLESKIVKKSPPEVLPSVSSASSQLGKPIIKTISGLPIGGSIYAGKNLYEQTTSQTVPAVSLKTNQQPALVSNTNLNVSVGFLSNQTPKSELKPKTKVKNLQKEVQTQTPKERQRDLIKEEQVSRLKTKQVQRTQQTQAQQTQQSQAQRTNSKPKVPKLLIPLLKSFKSKKESPLTYGDFEVYGRRFGKFKRIGIAKSKAEAKQLAKKFSLGGLGASTFIKKEGKKVPFNLGVGFRPSKVDSSIQVQNQRGGSGRLTTLGERREIKLLRKKRKLGVF